MDCNIRMSEVLIQVAPAITLGCHFLEYQIRDISGGGGATQQNVPHYTFDGYLMVGDPGCTETLSAAQTNRINLPNSLSKFVILMLLIVFAILNKQRQWYQGLSLNYGSVYSILFHFY